MRDDFFENSKPKADKLFNIPKNSDILNNSLLKFLALDIKGLENEDEINKFLTKSVPRKISEGEFDMVTDYAIYLLSQLKDGDLTLDDISELIKISLTNTPEEITKIPAESGAKSGVMLKIAETILGNYLIYSKMPIPEKVHNFPPNYSPQQRVLANAMVAVATLVVENRKNFLNDQDIETAREKIKEGNIVLVGDFKYASALFIGGPVTHALLYIGNGKFVHAVAAGVEEIDSDTVFQKYDTMVILRPKNIDQEKTSKAIEYAKTQIGKPYDFEFSSDEDKFFCSELVLKAYQKAGFKINPQKNVKYDNSIYPESVHPSSLFSSDMQIAFQSHNLRVENGEIELIKE